MIHSSLRLKINNVSWLGNFTSLHYNNITNSSDCLPFQTLGIHHVPTLRSPIQPLHPESWSSWLRRQAREPYVPTQPGDAPSEHSRQQAEANFRLSCPRSSQLQNVLKIKIFFSRKIKSFFSQPRNSEFHITKYYTYGWVVQMDVLWVFVLVWTDLVLVNKEVDSFAWCGIDYTGVYRFLTLHQVLFILRPSHFYHLKKLEINDNIVKFKILCSMIIFVGIRRIIQGSYWILLSFILFELFVTFLNSIKIRPFVLWKYKVYLSNHTTLYFIHF